MKSLRLWIIIGMLIPGHLFAGSERGFVSIFDGESLQGWDGDPRFWRAENGAIVGETHSSDHTAESTYLIWQGGELADFELKIEFKLRNHNSGISYRSSPVQGKTWSVSGYRAGVSEEIKNTGVAYGEGGFGLLADVGEKTIIDRKKGERQLVALLGDQREILRRIIAGQWNEYRISAVGNQLIHRINGVVVSEFSESNGAAKKGLLALELQLDNLMEVRFRNIRLRKLVRDDLKKILFLAGKKSHGYNAHEHNAGSQILARSLNESDLGVIAQVATEGDWPESWMGYDQPDAIVMYCDGLEAHLAKDHQEKIQRLVDKGCGVACLHFAVEVEPDVLGSTFLDWIGGYFEIGWSVNPFWTAEFKSFPDHPITNGVEPFTIRDEWYYHMRFRSDMAGVTPILSAVPPVRSLTSRSKNRDRGSNPAVMAAVQAGEPQHVAWAYERPSGGRGFGFTGGHIHGNWQNDNFRKIVLNALLWTAQMEVPLEGTFSRTPSDRDLELNQDYPKPE